MMRQKSIDTILLEAVEIEDPADRESYLDRSCGSDAELRRKVEKLIDDHFAAGDFLEEPLVERPENLLDAATEVEDVSLDFLTPSSDPGVLGRVGEYTITEVIGRGGMGIVLKGHDRHLNRTVAIKVLAPELSGNATARKRFVREAQAAAAIVHQHVITIHAVHEDRLPYLVMEYVHGESLQERIHREGPLELKEVLRIGTQVASGLAAAHAQGLIHRDVKPANIMLENGVQRVRLMDFGLARAVDDVRITRAGEITGTPQFMSPEQAQGKAVDTRSDLFSLGSVLYAMCTGRSPFRAETTVAALRRVCDDVPRPVREVNSDIPVWLTEIIDHLLEKDPDDRIQSASEVAELLESHLAHLQDPSSTPMPDTIPPAKRRASRASSATGFSRRWIIAGSVLLLLAATISVTEATGVTQFSTTVISIVRGDGTLVVEVDDPAVGITIEGEDVVITGAGPQEVRLRPGQYRFRATKDGEPVKQELVTITRCRKKVISVTLESVATKGNGSDAVDYRAVPDGSMRRIRRLAGHTGVITDLQTFRDGARCLTASHDGTIRSWEIPTSRLLRTFRFGNFRGGIRIALAPNQHLAAAAIDGKGTIQLFEVETGKALQKLSGHSDIANCLEFSPNGQSLLSRSRDKTLRLWDVETGKELHRLDCEPWWSWAAAFSPAGDALFYGDNGFTVCWNIEKKAETWRAGDDQFESQVASLGLSADGLRVAVGTFGGPIHLRDAKTGELLGTFVGHAAKSHSDLAFTPDGRHLLSGNNVDETLRVWSVETFTEVCRIKADRATVNKLRVLPDGRDVITAGGMRYEPLDEWIPEGSYDLHVWRLPEDVWPKNAEKTQSAVPTQKGPFVVLNRQGEEVRTFETLSDAVLGSSPGDTIEIRGDGPFASDTITILQPLVIRAAAGFRPVIELAESTSVKNQPLILTKAPLVIEGLELGRGEPARADESNYVQLIEGQNRQPIFVANCRLIINSSNVPNSVLSSTGRVLSLRNCEFYSNYSSIESELVAGGTCEVRNCVSMAGVFRFRAADLNFSDSSIHLQGNTIVGDVLSVTIDSRVNQTKSSGAPSPIYLRLSNNVIRMRDKNPLGVLHFHQYGLEKPLARDEVERLLPQRILLREEHNVYHAPAANLLYLALNWQPQTPTRGRSLADWLQFWNQSERGSAEGVTRFAGGDLGRISFDEITPKHFRLRSDSAGYRASPDGKDLGADIDVVGPGEAYARWKKTSEYQKWLAETTELMAGRDPATQ